MEVDKSYHNPFLFLIHWCFLFFYISISFFVTWLFSVHIFNYHSSTIYMIFFFKCHGDKICPRRRNLSMATKHDDTLHIAIYSNKVILYIWGNFFVNAHSPSIIVTEKCSIIFIGDEWWHRSNKSNEHIYIHIYTRKNQIGENKYGTSTGWIKWFTWWDSYDYFEKVVQCSKYYTL